MGDDPILRNDPLGGEEASCCEFLQKIWDNEVRGVERVGNLIKEGVNTALDNAKKNIASGNTIPQRILKDAIDNPLSIIDGAEGVTLGKDILEGANLTKTTENVVTNIEVKGLNNPFKNSSLGEIDKSLQKHVESGKLVEKPSAPGAKTYQNTKSGYSYNLDPGKQYKKGLEKPHIDVNYPKPKPKDIPKKKLEVAGGFKQ
jgi:hypothetical protein